MRITEGKASAKALRWKCAWLVQIIARRPVCMKKSLQRGRTVNGSGGVWAL